MPVCGIDLGGTNVRAGWHDESRGLVLAQEEDGDAALPAAVWFAGAGDVRVGASAAAAARSRHDEVITAVRAELLSDRPGDLGSRQLRYFHGRYESADAVASRVYSYAAERAAHRLGAPVRDVLISVPVSAGHRVSLLRRAATDAGLNVINSLPEPVAVAMHYGLVGENAEHVTAVCDLGATTLDVSVLRIRSRGVEILFSASEPVGGRTWDEVLAGDLLAQVASARRGPTARSGTVPDRSGLLAAAGALRVELTEAATATRRLSGPGYETQVRLDRERMEQLTAGLAERVVSSVQAAISTASAVSEHPPTLLLAGGAIRMPMVVRALRDSVRAEVRAADPEIAVVGGLVLASGFGALWVTRPGDAAAPDLRPPAPPRRDPDPPRRDPDPPAPPQPDLTAGRHVIGAGPAPPDPEPRTPGPSAAGQRPATHPGQPAAPAETLPPPQAVPQPAASTRHPAGAMPPFLPSGDGSEGQAPAGLTPRPVEHLSCMRRGRHLQVMWIWPDDSATARVQWRLDGDPPARHSSVRCSRRSYEHDGGFVIPIGLGGATITVEALVPGDGLDLRPPSSLRAEPLAPVVTYDLAVRRRARQWTVDLTFASEVDCELPPVQFVLGTGNYRPSSTRDGEVLREIESSRLTPGEPLTVTFRTPPRRGRCWLVCLLADPDASAVDLQPASLHRLRVQ